MPFGFPSATVTTRQAKALSEDGRETHLPEGCHLEILHLGADQDGCDGHIICRDLAGKMWAVMPGDLRL